VKRSRDRQPQAGAYDRALGLLARREHSGRELKDKLRRRGLDGDEVASALAQLQAKDYQNDDRFGEMLVRTRLEGGYGERWIVAELRTHGIPDERGHELVAAAEPDWPVLIRRQIRRRYGASRPSGRAERNKRAAFLLRRGFDASTVKLVVRAEGLDGSPDEAD
jgi:regulatory protein